MLLHSAPHLQLLLQLLAAVMVQVALEGVGRCHAPPEEGLQQVRVLRGEVGQGLGRGTTGTVNGTGEDGTYSLWMVRYQSAVRARITTAQLLLVLLAAASAQADAAGAARH